MSSSDANATVYAWPSTVAVANFVTVKPSLEGDERINSKIWKKQMLCLLQSQEVAGFVDGETPPPPEDEEKQKIMWRRTDVLVQGWILGSIGKDALDAVWDKPTARDIWLELETIFEKQEQEEEHEQKHDQGEREEKEDDEEEEEEKEKEDEDEEEEEEKEKEDEDEEEQQEAEGAKEEEEDEDDFGKYWPLIQAAMRGDWDAAKNFFPDINQLSTTRISSSSETTLQIAVMTGKSNIDFVKKLVHLMPPEALALKDRNGDTALDNAVMVGNTEVVKAMVKKNPKMLFIENSVGRMPVREAAVSTQKKTLEYLLSEHEVYEMEEEPLFESQSGITTLNGIIASEFVGEDSWTETESTLYLVEKYIALDLAYKYPKLALMTYEVDGRSALSTISETPSLFTRTDTFTWWQKLVYYLVPVEKSKHELGESRSVGRDVESLCSMGASVQAISQVGLKLKTTIWDVIENLVPKVKGLREKKATHQRAVQLAQYLCNKIISLPQKEAYAIFRKSVYLAAKYGISEIVEMIIQKYPQCSYSRDHETGKSVFMLAATYRFENVINLLHNMSDRKYLSYSSTDNEKNNLMHICGKLAPPDRLNLVAGAALQMQRELQWFKEMENFVHPSRRTWTNNDLKTPQKLFTEEHKTLKADGERWMKDTANACTIAAALIATVMFAAAFTLPGGLDSSNGFPLLLKRPTFMLFAVSDAVSLFASITSLLMFLSILTSRYAEEDFLYVLPKRLSIGLFSLFVSITFMMVAFSATLYLVFRRENAWFLALLAAFACFPVTSFVLLQFPLLVDVLYSTYGPGIFGKKNDRILY